MLGTGRYLRLKSGRRLYTQLNSQLSLKMGGLPVMSQDWIEKSSTLQAGVVRPNASAPI